MKHSSTSIVATLMLVWCMILVTACTPARATDSSVTATDTPNSLPSATSGGGQVSQPTPTGVIQTSMQVLIDHTLSLRLVEIELKTVYPTGNSRHLSAAFDDMGNYHLTQKFRGDLPAFFPEDLELPSDSTDIYVIGGKAYGVDPGGCKIEANGEGLSETLKQILNSSSGPGFWLKVLPQGSFSKLGSEQKGGFQASKYAVNGSVEGSSITGAIWVDEASQALIAAVLSVPGALFSSPTSPAGDPLVIEFSVQKAEVAPVTLSGTFDGETAPDGESEPPVSGLPAIVDTYPLLQFHMGAMGEIVYTKGLIWVGTLNGYVDVYSQDTGELVRSIPLRGGVSATSQLPVSNMIFDGTHVWVINMDLSDIMHVKDTLSVIDPANGKILKQWNISDESQWLNLSDPSLGMTPGKIWVMGNIIDAQTFELTGMYEPLDMHVNFAYDDFGWMWSTGHTAEIAGVVTYNAADPSMVRVNGDSIPSAGTGSLLCLADDRMWIASFGSVQAFAADGAKFGTGSRVLATQNLEILPPLDMVYDGNNLWLLKGGEGRGVLYQMDPVTGVVLRQLDVSGSKEGITPDEPQGMVYDGHDLWILGVLSLERVITD